MLVNLNTVLSDAYEKHYAVGLFNTTDTDMLEGVLSAAELMRSPVIIGTAEVLLPFGELELIAPALKAAAERASVPVVLNYDHGLTFDRCIEALKCGFTSIMFDGSAGSYEQNVRETAEMVRIAHAFGASVEGEIGHVGLAAEGDDAAADMYTQVPEAVAYLKATGVDALAVSIGTAHGAYKAKPKLDFNRLSELHAALPVPLVLHGGSGLTDDDFRTSIARGISKVNIFTDLCIAGNRAMTEGLSAGEDYLTIRKRKVSAICEAAMKKIALFGSVGRA